MFNEQLDYYCFNINCKISIYNSKTCLVIPVPIEVAFTRKLTCIECGTELLSPLLIDIKRDIAELLADYRSCNIIVIDDDAFFHQAMKAMIANHELLSARYYLNAREALNNLRMNKQNRNALPNLIFLDIEMPMMDGWEFLKHFHEINKTLKKPVSVYILSNSVDPSHQKRAKVYSFVKGIISKPFTRYFVEKVNELLLESSQKLNATK